VVVTLQMVLDLIVLGLGVRVFVGAARLGRQRRDASGRPAGAPAGPRRRGRIRRPALKE